MLRFKNWKSPIISAKRPKKIKFNKIYRKGPIRGPTRSNRWSDQFKPMIRPGGFNPFFNWLRVFFSVTRSNRVECGLGPNPGWLDPWTALLKDVRSNNNNNNNNKSRIYLYVIIMSRIYLYVSISHVTLWKWSILLYQVLWLQHI